MPILKLYKTSSFERRCNIYCHLLAKEYNSTSSHRRIHHILGTLITKGSYSFKKAWSRVSNRHIACDGRLAFFDNYINCFDCGSTSDISHKKFSVQKNKPGKIEDALLMEGFPETVNLPHKGYKGCLFAVTKDHFLLRVDIENGAILEEVYMDCPTMLYSRVSRKIQWNVVDESFIVVSKKGRNSPNRPVQPGHRSPESKVIELMIMSCMPLDYVCCLGISNQVFGRDLVEAAIFLDILMVMHSNDYIRMYSMERIIEEFSTHTRKLYDEVGDGKFYGVHPTPLSLNIHVTERPTCLFEVRCQNRDVMLTMPPCFYVMWPHGDHGGYCCYSFETNRMVEGGRLEAEENAIEERVSLHADDSGRIIHMKTSSLRVMKLVGESRHEERHLVEDFVIDFTEEPKSPVMRVSQSGRVIKQRVMQDCGQLAERVSTEVREAAVVEDRGEEREKDKQVVLTMVYNEDQDMMVVVSITSPPGDDAHGCQCCTMVGFYDNWNGTLLRQFVLEESVTEALERSVCYNLDTITHVYKTERGKFECHVYKLQPMMDMGDEWGVGKKGATTGNCNLSPSPPRISNTRRRRSRR